jgi:hypothetical protein
VLTIQSKSEGKHECEEFSEVQRRERESLYMRKVLYPRTARNHIIAGAEHPEPNVILRSGWMVGVLGSMSGKALPIPPNDVEILRAKPRLRVYDSDD